MITGTTKTVGLLGWPVGHSFSPLIHNAAFRALGLDYVYIPLPVRSEDVAQAVAGLRAFGFAGANVTVPHKVSVIPFLDRLDASAALVGAVNTIVLSAGQLVGYNTDMTGFIASLQAAGVAIEGCRAAVMGAGGAARAVVCGLVAAGAANVTVGARDAGKARLFAASFAAGGVTGCGWEEADFRQALAGCQLLINATPVGMHGGLDRQLPLDWAAVNSPAVACDLVYNPLDTRFLRTAREQGHRTVDGLGMLVEQAVLAFALWTGREAPRTAVRQALGQALGLAEQETV